MKHKKHLATLGLLLFTFVLTGCGDSSDESGTAEVVDPSGLTVEDFSLVELEGSKPVVSNSAIKFVDEVVEPVKVVETVAPKSYEAFSSVSFESLRGEAPFALFFTADECSRCKFIDDFVDRNLSALPAGTQILKADWDQYPNLQEELGASRPGTMVFYEADGTPGDALFAPPIDRITEFFTPAG